MSNEIYADENSVDFTLQEQKKSRLHALSNVFARALSVITGKIIDVNVCERKDINTPAWSQTNAVWLNLPKIKDDLSIRSLTSLNGLNFHELAHLLYSSRNGSKFIQLIKNSDNAEQLWESYNCLEDSRIENLLIAYLPSVKNWLIATIGDYLLDSDSKELFNRSFPLLYGRYYLPKEIRQLSADSYLNQEHLKSIKNIIDQYTSLIITNENAEQAFNLVKDFNDLLNQLPPTMCDNPFGEGGGKISIRIPNPNGHHSRPTQGLDSAGVRPKPTEKQLKDLANAIKNKKVDIEINLDKSSKTKQSSLPNDLSNGGKVEISFDSNGAGDSDLDLPDLENDFGSNDSSNQNNSGGSSKSNAMKELNDVLNETLDDVFKDLSKEINQMAKQIGIKELIANDSVAPKLANVQEILAPANLISLSRSFQRELERLRADYEPKWITGQSAGKINAYRYLSNQDYETIFDSYEVGRDDITEIEAVILLDKSGSMEGENATQAYQSMFSIKRALDSVKARTSVCVFDYQSAVLYSADEKTKPTHYKSAGAFGGTDPYKGLCYAKNIFANSEKPIKILFVITDGEYESTEADSIVKELRNAGVLTCLAFIHPQEITKERLENYRHSFELLTQIQSANQILNLGKNLVRLGIKKNLVA